ncbi:extracellular solute-binding protein [Micrococcus luteus]|uniref:extracellular solute-binding protein n=1 Tax=Micrococcus luteus TaxID=1270 RepID=UPI001475DEC2|nr:extracellular solute-binding protein [Micrococcus luteus]MCV7486777.1 extracellular solute-binding protein [Micrococcus luteus]MCV7600296.1 extracellular solute-binding protein [Micrococcus luteus]MCV7744175.1 extracellular solute-binding protein [Micrococcus luteus]NME16185.1 extracellular solute-binding protein [Micrococcus luteus]
MRHDTRARQRRRATLAGAVAAGALILAGCAPAEQTPTLTWYTNPDDGGQAKIAAQCTDAANGRYRVETSMLPTDAASQREQLTRRLAAGDTSMDIMSLDPPFVPELAEPGFLAPVPEEMQAYAKDNALEGALAAASWKDELVTVPFWANTQLLWYRKSVAEAAGLDMSQPVTWDQLIEAARSQDKDLAVQGARAESMTVWLNALIEGGGEQIVPNAEAPTDEVTTNLDSEAGRTAARIISTIGKEGLGSAGLPTQDENASMLLFQGENGSFMVNWPFVWPATLGSVEEGSLPEDLPEDIGWAVYPRTVEGEDAAPPVGGINLGVGAKSEHQDLAWDAISCITTTEHQSQYFVENGNPPADPAAYDAPEVSEKYPMADTIRESLELGAPRPQTPYYNEVSTAIQQRYAPPSGVSESTPAETDDFIQEVLRGERLL